MKTTVKTKLKKKLLDIQGFAGLGCDFDHNGQPIFTVYLQSTEVQNETQVQSKVPESYYRYPVQIKWLDQIPTFI